MSSVIKSRYSLWTYFSRERKFGSLHRIRLPMMAIATDHDCINFEVIIGMSVIKRLSLYESFTLCC